MKTALLASLLVLSANAFADFSNTIIEDKTSSIDKDFSLKNMERLHRDRKEIVLTFDDGPTPGVTEKVLDVLKNNNIKATFFVIASKAQAAPHLMQRILDEGHIVANHSLNHKSLRDLSFFSWKKTVRAEVVGAHQILAPYMANSNKFFYRAPEGAWDTKYASLLNEEYAVARDYVGPILWDIGGAVVKNGATYTEAADWACWSKKMTVDECLSGYVNESIRKKGGVVLMHDLRGLSAQLLEKYIPKMVEAGMTFKNLDEIGL